MISFNQVRSNHRFKVVAVIPAYNEERTIAKVVLLTKKYVDIVVVGDDGSSDMTGEIAKTLGAVVIRNSKNRGKGYTIRRLFAKALELGADIIVTLDADGQHNPNHIPKLVEPLIKGQADMVIGSRYAGIPPKKMPLYRKIGLKIIRLFHKPVVKKVKDTQSGYRAYTRKIVEILARELETEGYGTETEQIYLAKKYGWKIMEVPVTITYETEKPSKKHPVRHATEILASLLKLITHEKPLLLLGLPGIILTLIGFASATYVVWVFNQTRYFSVPATLIAIAFTFIGMLLVIASLILYAIANIRKIQQ